RTLNFRASYRVSKTIFRRELKVFTFVYKAEYYPYPAPRLLADIFLLLVLVTVDFIKNAISSRGNRQRILFLTYVSILLTLVVIGLIVWLLLGQAYTLFYEMVLGTLGGAVWFLQVLFSILASGHGF
ncbi:unnamed protein product, partial [Schistocephalus solidus]|uniref:PKD_channel domain-containing protein n=1 Tax=Schistocephalus solidus TaxID=70667 RepID=A0A183S9S9_SCHSO